MLKTSHRTSPCVTQGEESVKFVCIGDPHFKEDNIIEARSIIDKTVEYVKEADLDFLVILGDLLDKHERYYEKPYNLAMEWLWKLQEVVPLFFVVGNHDLRNNKQFLTSAHAYNPCKAWPNITICDNVVIRDIKGMRFTFVPYVYPGRFTEALETSTEVWETSACIFAHQEFVGCTLSGTTISTVGDKWDSDNPMIISGHIHDEHTLVPKDPEGTGYIHYVGALIQASFGEKDNNAMWLCEIEKDEGDEEEGESCNFTHEKVDLEFPKKVEHHMDVKDLTVELVKEYSLSRDKHKIKLSLTQDELLIFRKSEVQKELKRSVGVYIDPIVSREDSILLSKKINKSIKGNFTCVLETLIKQENDMELCELFEEVLRGT